MLRRGAVMVLLLAAALLLSGSRNYDALVRAEADLDSDGWTEEYLLANNTLTVKEGKQELWKSPEDYCVDSFTLGDVDNDGHGNLVISLWKKGSFAKTKPFWHTKTDDSYKNHLFVYKLYENKLKPVWCSSNLDRPILSFAIRDADGDGLNDLIVEEGQYKKIIGERYAIDPDGKVRNTVWKWEEWGFYLSDALNEHGREL